MDNRPVSKYDLLGLISCIWLYCDELDGEEFCCPEGYDAVPVTDYCGGVCVPTGTEDPGEPDPEPVMPSPPPGGPGIHECIPIPGTGTPGPWQYLGISLIDHVSIGSGGGGMADGFYAYWSRTVRNVEHLCPECCCGNITQDREAGYKDGRRNMPGGIITQSPPDAWPPLPTNLPDAIATWIGSEISASLADISSNWARNVIQQFVNTRAPGEEDWGTLFGSNPTCECD